MKTLLRIVSSALLSMLLTTLCSPAFAQLGSLSTDLVYYPITPCRIIDTRKPGAMPGILAAGSTRSFVAWNSTYAGQGGVATDCNLLQSTNNAAIVLNLTTVMPDTSGFITVFPGDVTQPTTSTLNFTAGSVIGNNATLKINQTGTGSAFKVFSTSNVHLIADVVGYYARPKATAIECTQVVSGVTTLQPGESKAIYSPQCSVGYTMMSGSCYRAPGTTTGNTNVYGFAMTGSTSSHPFTYYCGMNNNHPSEPSDVQGYGLCCRIPGR